MLCLLGQHFIIMRLNENATRVKEVNLKTKNETIRPWMFKKSELAVYLGLSEDKVEKLGPVPSGNVMIKSELPYL